MWRVSVVGNSGSGKSTLARTLAARLDVPYVELDAIFHQPGWTELPVDEFRARVGDVVAGDAWVVDGNYNAVRDRVWARADTVVWVDPPRPVVMRRIVGRSVSRVVRRTELWAGNRERWRSLVSLDPRRSIVMWAWTQHGKYQARYGGAMTDPAWRHLEFVRVRSADDVEELLARCDG